MTLKPLHAWAAGATLLAALAFGPLVRAQSAPAPASAAPFAPSPAPVAATTAPAAGASVTAGPGTAAAPGPVNPYTGVAQSREQLLRELEEARTQTALREERVKQEGLKADLEIVPAKKKFEGSQYTGKSRPRFDPVADTTPPTPAPAVVKPKVVKATPVVDAAPPPVRIRVTSVIGSGADATAMLDVNGQTLVARNGETTPYGVLTFENASTVTLGARHLTLPSKMISRMAVSDTQPIDAKASAEAGTSAMATGGTVPTFNPGLTTGGGRAVLPPPIPAPPAGLATSPSTR